MAQEISWQMLPTSNKNCEFCVWRKDPDQPSPSSAEAHTQRMVLAECIKTRLGLPASEAATTPSDNIRANHRLDMLQWCSMMMTSGLCKDYEARAEGNHAVYEQKNNPDDSPPTLRLV